jgi:hypothetical protein
MMKKVLGIFICVLFFATIIPTAALMNQKMYQNNKPVIDLNQQIIKNTRSGIDLDQQIYENRPVFNRTAVSTSLSAKLGQSVSSLLSTIEDFDPLDDYINVTVNIKEIRALKTIDIMSDPDFYLKVIINDQVFTSDVWENKKYLDDLNWSASCEVPKDEELVNIIIALYDKAVGIDFLCDISPDYGSFQQRRTAELTYSIATGIWWGDDNGEMDPSGIGRLSGIDDNSCYEQDRDCELWFTITQTDFDNDGLPYWLESYIYGTDPTVDNRGDDSDEDGVPIEWEHEFGLWYEDWWDDYQVIWDPFVSEDHAQIDYDQDGLTNIEEFKAWQWGSDPWQLDIFLEIDQMEKGPNGEGNTIPLETFDMIRDAYAKHNVVWHVDDGRLGGGEMIPFKERIEDRDLGQFYWKYFMHSDAQNWRRGVFRWCIISYNYTWAKGFVFLSNISYSYAVDCIFLSTKYIEQRTKQFFFIGACFRGTFNKELNRACVYTGSIMHETGHTLAIWAPGCDAPGSYWPWQRNFWVYAPYKSVMNYRYIYNGINDYSDGSNGKNDFNDWAAMDLTYFNPFYG